MLSYSTALEKILETARKLPSLAPEKCSLQESLGRVCADTLLSPIDVPSFANSSMDGFAVRSAETRAAQFEKPLSFQVVGSIAAGDIPPRTPQQNGVWEIMTGAPFPEGFDAAVKVEDVIVHRDREGRPISIELREPAEPKQFWRGAGEDFQKGSEVISRGTRIEPRHILALASLGINEISVFKKPRVALIATGRELVPVECTPEPGQIRNSTTPFILSALSEFGADVAHVGTIADDPEEFETLLKSLLSESWDVILTTGAVSMGKYDFVLEEVTKQACEVWFHKVSIRPGKPLLFGGFVDGPILFGLPGNPVSGVVALKFFLLPFLRAWLEQSPESPMKARLAHNVKKPEGLRCFFKAKIQGAEDGSLRATILPGQMSFMVSPLLEANAWAILPEAGSQMEEHSLIDVFPF